MPFQIEHPLARTAHGDHHETTGFRELRALRWRAPRNLEEVGPTLDRAAEFGITRRKALTLIAGAVPASLLLQRMFIFIEHFDSNPNSHADAKSYSGAPAVSI